MGSVTRAIVIYAVLMLLFRVSGRRTLSQMTSFDLILSLIISEGIQQALLDGDNSMTNGVLVAITLVMLDVGMSLWKQRSHRVEKVFEGVPMVIVEDGRVLKDRMEKARIDEDDVLSAARELQGIERLSQIKFAVLERTGQISVIPKNA